MGLDVRVAGTPSCYPSSFVFARDWSEDEKIAQVIPKTCVYGWHDHEVGDLAEVTPYGTAANPEIWYYSNALHTSEFSPWQKDGFSAWPRGRGAPMSPCAITSHRCWRQLWNATGTAHGSPSGRLVSNHGSSQRLPARVVAGTPSSGTLQARPTATFDQFGCFEFPPDFDYHRYHPEEW